MEQYSVLMSVYINEDPQYFDKAIESILKQTVPTDDFVIVCDGPVTPEHDAVFEKYKALYPGVIHDVRLPQNVGIGAAANIGLKECRHELIAKMDADDLAMPDRCEKQLRYFAENPRLAVLGGFIEEFDRDENQPYDVRVVPLTNEAIHKYARRRQAFNNVTVMYRKSAVMAVGGYRPLRRAEDFDLYVRLLHSGCYAENMPDVLVKVRADRDACGRRTSWETLKGFVKARWLAYRLGFSSIVDFSVACGAQCVMFLFPRKLQNLVYSRLLRKPPRQQSEENPEEREASGCRKT